MSSTTEPAIWSCDTVQQIPCFNSCQMAIIWMSNIKVNEGEAAFLHCRSTLMGAIFCYPVIQTDVPSIHAVGHDDHEKMNALVLSILYRFGAAL